MRLHLPVSLRKSLLSCVVAAVASTYSCGAVWASSVTAPQNLIFEGETLTWNTNTDNKAFTNAEGEASSFTTGDNVTFASEATVALGEDIKAGQINIASGANVVIELNDNGLNFDTLSLLGGSLDTGFSLKIGAGETLAVGSNGSVLQSSLVLEDDARLSVDYSGTASATRLNDSVLVLQGVSLLQLINCGSGDGKTYTLLTGVSGLVDAQGNPLTQDDANNAISNYFDTTRPGTGFWAGATLEINDGQLQLVRHNEEVQDSAVIKSRQDNPSAYQYYARVSFENISYVRNSSPSASAAGGAIYEYEDTLELSNNGCVSFARNTISATSSSKSTAASMAFGGCIDTGKTVNLSNNGSVLFTGNTASSTATSSSTSNSNYARADSSGGAIYGNFSSAIDLSNNGSVLFEENSVSSSATVFNYYTSNAYANGGAIYGISCTIDLNNNGSVCFSGNSATSSGSAYGGAILGTGTTTIRLRNNGGVWFTGNTAATIATSTSYIRATTEGGAIYGGSDSTIDMSNNGSVCFSGNAVHSASKLASASVSGGAIYTSGNLFIQNNDSVLFEKNAEILNGNYCLRSIYAGGNGVEISLSSASGSKIELRDAVYIAEGSTVKLNADYIDAEGHEHRQQGDILFTGANTKADLHEVKGNEGSDEEILASRTSEVNAKTNLYGGRLRVEDEAVYKGMGITAHAGSESTVLVKDAVLDHAGYELYFFEGTTLESLGESEIFGDIIVESTATAAFSAFTRLEGSLTLASGSTLLLDGELTLDGNLALGTSLTLGGNMLEMMNLLQGGQTLPLITGLDSLVVQGEEDGYASVVSGQELRAADYFSTLDASKNLVLNFNGEVGSLTVTHVIPEPATATLSLLALATLAARRCRK